MADFLFEREVLNAGFVRVIDCMGNDRAVVQAARVSYGKHDENRPGHLDRSLIRYLMRHRHTSPFEMCEVKFQIRAPIFVARQWMRHRTASINEISARYVALPADTYVPEPDQIRPPAENNKQGRANAPLPDAEFYASVFEAMGNNSAALYRQLLDRNVAPELARMVLPVSVYTEWVWKIDLHNLLHFLELRLHEHAQYEIREYAEAIWEFVRNWVPLTAEAFKEYRLDGVSLSASAVALLDRVLSGRPVEKHHLDKLPISELSELWSRFPAIKRAVEGSVDRADV